MGKNGHSSSGKHFWFGLFSMPISTAFSLIRHNLDLAAQTAYFIAIVITQIGNLYGNKTTRRSVFQQGIFGNRFMVFAVFFTFALACFLLYIPKLNRALNLAPNRFLWWLPAIPFFLYLFAFNEARKFFIRKYPNRFPARQLTYWTFPLSIYWNPVLSPSSCFLDVECMCSSFWQDLTQAWINVLSILSVMDSRNPR